MVAPDAWAIKGTCQAALEAFSISLNSITSRSMKGALWPGSLTNKREFPSPSGEGMKASCFLMPLDMLANSCFYVGRHDVLRPANHRYRRPRVK